MEVGIHLQDLVRLRMCFYGDSLKSYCSAWSKSMQEFCLALHVFQSSWQNCSTNVFNITFLFVWILHLILPSRCFYVIWCWNPVFISIKFNMTIILLWRFLNLLIYSEFLVYSEGSWSFKSLVDVKFSIRSIQQHKITSGSLVILMDTFPIK